MYSYDNYRDPFYNTGIGNQAQSHLGTGYPQTPAIINSNIIKVTSLDEAIMRTNLRNCEMVYFDQNGKTFYIVRVDGVGNKSWDILSYATANPNNTAPATKEDIAALTERIEALENRKSGEQNV